MYILIQPPAAKPWRRNVDTPDEIATAFFEMACVGQTRAHVFGHGATSLHIENLDDLLEVLQTAHALASDVVAEADLSSLPTFGGTAPSDTVEVWSWDANHLLVGTSIGDMRIVDRDGGAS